ncbi:MAG TPA: HEAT repeat domain-containing protein [Planctomycetota bacterium]|nr:HEAT repeat domain-containing protein [Planctomycetota bacterium]
MRRGLLLLLLTAAVWAEDADFGVDAMRARVEALRPDAEAALGAPLGDVIEVRATTPDELKDLLTREFVAERAGIAGGPRGKALGETCATEAAFASKVLFAKVEIGNGVIHVCPDNFRTMAAIDDSLKGLLSQDLLDTVLLHEMVHVFQSRRLGLARFLGTPTSMEQLTARSAVIEGHAQYAGRIAAKRRGLDEAMALLDRAQTEVPASVKDPALRHVAEVMGANLSFAYVEGERFVGAIVAKLGYGKAVERLFSTPPETLRAVSNPGEYLEPPAPDTSLDDMASLVQRLLSERGGQTQTIPFPAPALRAALSPAGPKVAEAAMGALDKALAVASQGDPQIVIAFLRARDEAGGKILYDADVATSKAKDEMFGKPGSQIRIVKAEYVPVSFGGADGIEATKTVEIGSTTRQRIGTVLVRRGPLLLEIMVSNATTAGDDARRLARETLELLRGAEVADPWDGKKGGEARKALLGALADAHWGVRWRATRNLARMKEDPEIDAALILMLRDPDASVSMDALRGLRRRGSRELPREDRDALATHPEWEVRLAYLRMGEDDADTAARESQLLAALRDGAPPIRAYAFQKLAKSHRRDIPWELNRAGIEDPDETVRAAAMEAAPYAGLPADARPVLLKALRDGDVGIRWAAAMRVDQWVKESDEVREALIVALDDPSPWVRRHAAAGLAEAGPAAAAAIPRLCGMLDDKDVREAAAETLGKIGVEDGTAIARLEGLLEDPDLDFRFEVARALGRLGYDARKLAPVFVEALRKGDSRYDAAAALGELGVDARPYVPDLVAALEDEKPFVRRGVARVLGDLGATAEEALPALDALGGPEEERAATEPIGLGGEPDEADVRRAARDAAKSIRAALAASKR